MPFAGIRVGQASNPGPFSVSVDALALAAKRLQASQLSYDTALCRKNTSGSHGSVAKKSGTYAFSATTANTTCWSSAKRYLARANSEAVMLQEHKLATQL